METVVKEAYVHMLKDESLVQNVETLYIVEFLFDKSWDGCTKAVILKADSVEPFVKLTDDRCIIPAEHLKQVGVSLCIGVSGAKDGEQKDTAWYLTGRIMYAIGAVQLAPSPHFGADIRAQILEAIREDTATDEEVNAALDDAFASDWTLLDDPEHPGDMATDEEVEDVLDDVFGSEP